MNEGAKTGFYKENTKVLNFKIDKDFEKILFNHYIKQKENYQRLKDDLPRGQFYISVRNVAKDLNISRMKAQRLIEEFIELGIIESVFKSTIGSAKSSIFKYVSSAYDENGTVNEQYINNDKASVFNGLTNNDNKNNQKSGTVDGTVSGTVKHSNFNGLSDVVGTGSGTVDGTSKKELLKKNYIYSANIEELWSLYPKKRGKAQAIKKIPRLLKEHGKEELKRCIERYSKEIQGKEKDYILNGSTFFNGRYIDYLDSNYKEHENKPKIREEDYIKT